MTQVPSTSNSSEASRLGPNPRVLSACQLAAIEAVAEGAKKREGKAREQIEHILKMCDIAPERFERATSALKTHGRVALHFHPDRPGPEGRSVSEALLADGLYRSQFETRISNGGVSAFPGGARHRWESQMFGGAYDGPKISPAERPKYGALDIMLHSDGPSPRFGCCYFLLAPDVSRRSTFTYQDSHENPDEKGTFEVFDDILASLLRDFFQFDSALGESDFTPIDLIDHLVNRLHEKRPDPSSRSPHRNLNQYIEAQVHGDIALREDVERLVADPCFINTKTGDVLGEICQQNKIQLDWHSGFALAIQEIPRDFRGPTMPSLAERISKDNYLDAAAIGNAAVALKNVPDAFADRGTEEEVLQELKLLWHVLVRYGRPFKTFSPGRPA